MNHYVPNAELRRQMNTMGGSDVQPVASLRFLPHCAILLLLTLSKIKNPRDRFYRLVLGVDRKIAWETVYMMTENGYVEPVLQAWLILTEG